MPSQPTSSYGVPPVQIADEDIRPRGATGKRPPVFGYYPPSQRVMPRVNRKFVYYVFIYFKKDQAFLRNLLTALEQLSITT